MKILSKYENYTVEDFVEDKDFHCWVVSPTEILNSFWSNFQNEHPEKIESIKLACQIVNALSFEEQGINRKEYQDSLDYLKGYISQKSHRKNITTSMVNRWSKVAAILLIPILTISIYLFIDSILNHPAGQIVRYIVPEGQKSNLILPDGTKVWLNSGSQLSVTTNGSKSMRTVQLLGEAYFDVAKDKKLPFLVETKDYTVKVYGTKFNVCAYGYMNTSETTLKEGSISILTNSEEEIKMVPGQRFFLTSEKKYSISQVDPDLYMNWKDNILKINNEKLQDLVVQMEHWYGINIRIDEFEKVKDLRYTLTIKTESLREMLELMKFVTPFEYKIEGENVILKYNSN